MQGFFYFWHDQHYHVTNSLAIYYLQSVNKKSPINSDPEAKQRVIAGVVIKSINGQAVSTSAEFVDLKKAAGKKDVEIIFICEGGYAD